jgi:hypothetical protein
MRYLAILTVRNEGSLLLEWLAHHRAVGFTDFLIFSNDCDDGTDQMLDRLQALGWLTHVRNDAHQQKGPQWSALARADNHPLVAGADWILCLDIDEFVNIHVGAGTIPDLLSALPEATAIPLTWRLFGNAGHIAITDAPVTETFVQAAPAILHWPWRAALFKTLFRNDGTYRKLGVHRPRNPNPEHLAKSRWFDGSGRPLSDAFRRTRIFSDFGQDNYGLGQLNHYALGPMEGYLVKCDRGRANREGSALDMGYWVERNFCDVEDRTILRLAPQVRALRDDLYADPAIDQLHRRALHWRKSRFEALMQREEWRALFGRLLMASPTRTLSAAEARLVWSHVARPAE